MKPTLTQHKGWNERRFEIALTEIKIWSKDLDGMKEWSIQYENLGNKPFTRRASMRVFYGSLVFAVFWISISILIAVINWPLSAEKFGLSLLFLSGVLFFVLVIYIRSSENNLYLTGGELSLEIFRDKPTEAEVDNFVGSVIEARNAYLKEHYAVIDAALSLDAQLNSLLWLRGQEVITEEEFYALKNKVFGESNTNPTKQVLESQPLDFTHRKITQKRLWDLKEFEITNSGLKIKSVDSSGMQERFVEFESLGYKTEIKRESKGGFHSALLLSLSFFAFTLKSLLEAKHIGILQVLLLVVVILCCTAVSTVAFFVSGKRYLYLTSERSKVEFYEDVPSLQEAHQFVKDVVTARNLYFRKKYATIDADIPIESQLNVFNWLHNEKVISSEELQNLREVLLGLKKSDGSPMGFVSPN